MSGMSAAGSSSPNSNLAVSPFHESFNTQNVDAKAAAAEKRNWTPRQTEVWAVGEKLFQAQWKVDQSKGKNVAEFMNLRKAIAEAERSPYKNEPSVQANLKGAKSVEAYYRPAARAAAQSVVDQLR